MKKPEKKTKSYYDYHECRDYLQEKYGYKERDYLGKFKGNSQAEYLDFWHWVAENYHIYNGSDFSFSEDSLNDHKEWKNIADWQEKIYRYYLDEFADENGVIEFNVWW